MSVCGVVVCWRVPPGAYECVWCGGVLVCFPLADLLHAGVCLVSEEDVQLAEECLTVCLVLCLCTR